MPVREAEALDAALSCFVGDFAGDYTMAVSEVERRNWGSIRTLTRLVGRDLGTGLGLGAFKLLRLASATSPLGAAFTDAG